MSSRPSAVRYARALLDVAATESDPVKAGADLAAFAALVAGHADLARALTAPAVPAAGKRAIVEALGAKLGCDSAVTKLLVLLATRGRLEIVGQLASVYREQLEARQQIVRAHVTSAAPLDQAKTAALADRLSAVTGCRVTVETAGDAALIGGLVARLGSTVYDGSVKTQLQKMRARLARQADART